MLSFKNNAFGARDVIESVVHLPSTYEALRSIPSMPHSYKLSIQKLKVEGSEKFKVIPQPYTKFKVSLGCVWSRPETKHIHHHFK